jgi:hypothetical protein
MPFKQKNMFFINFFLCGIARFHIKLLPYKYIAPYFGTCCRMMVASTIISRQQIQQALLIGRSVKLAARFTPWDSSCLTQAMVAKFWCQYHRIPYLFFIGFAKNGEKPLGKEAHAWITAGPVALTGGHSLSSHQVVLSYSNQMLKSPLIKKDKP